MDINWTQVTKAMVAKATNYLGGETGNDYARSAEDMAQDTLLLLLEKEMASTEEAIMLGTEILRLDCVDLKRVEGRRRELEQENAEIINRNLGANWTGDDPSEVIEAEERLEQINKLSPILADAFRGYVVEGRSYEEIAEAAGTSPATIRKRVQRAKEELGA